MVHIRSGDSIQQVIDHAAPGDIVDLGPGTYRESVTITVPHLTLRGVGRRTVIRPGAIRRSRTACASAGSGICVLGRAGHPLAGVRISSLTVMGFRSHGIWGSWTDRMAVTDVVARGNGKVGIGQEHSTRGRFRYNAAIGNRQAGIMLANVMDREGPAIDTKGTVIDHNRTDGNHIGVLIRRARRLAIWRNTVTRNCGGIFVVGDENIPRAGDVTITRNRVQRNNAYCPANRRLPAIQGTGILLTGAEQTLVAGNSVRGNTGRAPMSGGIVLFRSRAGAPNSHIVIRDNLALDNRPADLADRDIGKHNSFSENVCRTSQPKGRCHAGQPKTRTTP